MNGNPTTHDVIIIGGGHNGLVCACYLAKAGLQVKVLERRSVVGGAAVTEEFHPGFRNSVASYTVSLLNPKVIEDLNLVKHGLTIVEREMNNFLPIDNQHYLVNGSDLKKEFSKFSKKDADRADAFFSMLENVADVLRGLLLDTPPNIGGNYQDIIKGLKLALKGKQMSMSLRRDVLDLFTKSAAEILDQWFESEAIKALFAFDSIVGNFATPDTPGSAYVLLHHVFGEINGKKGAWGHAIGGMGAITQMMQKEAVALGVDIQLDADVAQVNITNNQVTGVTLQDGSVVHGTCIAANIAPKLLYSHLIDQHHLDADFKHRIAGIRSGSGTFRMNVALNELPDFTCSPGKNVQPHHRSGIIIAPSMRYMEQAYFDAKTIGWSRKPIVEILIPSTVDESLAPPGKHVASLFCQQFNPHLPNQQSWHDVKEDVADLIIDTVNHYAPNFKTSILGRSILSPLDLEQKFGLIDGDIFHGALNINQLFSNRPVMGHGNYRGPIKHLYMCGAGTHPGGGVTGVPGHNAAKEIIKDFRKNKLLRKHVTVKAS